MKYFEMPEIEIIQFSVEDIVTVSYNDLPITPINPPEDV